MTRSPHDPDRGLLLASGVIPTSWPSPADPGDLPAAALAYAEAGLPVFPVTPGAKHPLGGLAPRGFQNASADPERVRAWWRRAPLANIGLATGAGLVVLDVDCPKGGVLDPSWPETRTASTANEGLHLFFLVDEPVGCSVGQLGRGIDVRGDGG